jgi:hypothetical protein
MWYTNNLTKVLITTFMEIGGLDTIMCLSQDKTHY